MKVGRLFGIVIATLFLAVISGLAVRGTLPLAIPAIYLTASLVTVVAYVIDKSAARSGAWRTRERTLHLFALIGGWPGALFAQQVFRHKSQKTSFRLAVWTTVVLNCGALAWFWWTVSR